MKSSPRTSTMGGSPSSPSRFLEQVRQIVLSRLVGTDAQALLFGSWARGDADRASDIDVAIEGARPLPEGLVEGLREALEESDVPYRIDVVDLSRVSGRFRARVLREGIPWTS